MKKQGLVLLLILLKTSLSIDNDPPMNASGTDDIMNGASILGLIFPALI